MGFLVFLPWNAPGKPVTGFADLHNHMFAEYAFGGAWLHGSIEGEAAKALASCDSEDDFFGIRGDHARVRIPFLSRFIGRTEGSSGDTGAHPGKHEGYPDFKGFPRWDSIAHQQVWGGHLKAAHDRGLNLLVVSLVNFEPLCELMPPENRKTADCSDQNAFTLQLDAAWRFQKNHPWFQIVRTPKEARRAIERGNLAVVLSLEASHVLGDGDWLAEFNHLTSRGVTTLQLAHQWDNRFAGVALHNRIFRVFAWLKDFDAHGRWWQILTPGRFGFQYDHDSESGVDRNRKGLTPEGRELVLEMMRRGMPIDLAHLSEATIRDIRALSPKGMQYPIYVSHGHFRSAMDDGKFSHFEKSSPEWVLDAIRDSGGVFGLRTGPEKTKTIPESRVPNDCQGSTKSFAQAYQYGRLRNLKIGFGSDLNGFIQQTRPRFGGRLETCGGEPDPTERTRQQKAQLRPLHSRFDQSGFGDISLLPDLLQDAENSGMDGSELRQSAEDYLRMWEKAGKLAHPLR